MDDSKAVEIRAQGVDVMLVGTLVGAAVGGMATWFLSREENRRKAVSFWDEVKEETIDYANFLFRKTRVIKNADKKMIK